ncbi:hypothetical protein ILUMI_19760 [Ignelater luminosus]|uniref:Uncharacterized protein n=1 Tax=Ignelater luminosus TaxID=2038154 RepID=A0A8K0CJI7_IGNLU|nr:hypothetical protein ILUMI_19760 [Ignelater luminosus]
MRNGKETCHYLQFHHLETFNSWLAYFPSLKGLLYKFCPWFTPGHVATSQKTTPLQKVVTKPLKSFKDFLGKTGDLIQHEQIMYCKRAVQDAQSGETETHYRECDFLERQGIPFRGHKDDGVLLNSLEGQGVCATNNELSSITNEGNFRKLLRYRIACADSTLEEHLKNSSSRATYISKNTQNELIKICGEIIVGDIVKKVNKAGIWFCANYSLHLSLDNCVGIGTDGCSKMMSNIRGAVQQVQMVAIQALRMPCFSHKLNNSLSSSNKVQDVRKRVRLDRRGYTLVRFLFLGVNFVKYNPLKAFIPLPLSAKRKKAAMSVQNSGQRCFAWSVLSALAQPQESPHRCGSYSGPEQMLNLGGLQFPLKLKNSDEFTRLNSDISINVYGLEEMYKSSGVVYETVGPLHYATEKKRQNVKFFEAIVCLSL